MTERKTEIQSAAHQTTLTILRRDHLGPTVTLARRHEDEEVAGCFNHEDLLDGLRQAFPEEFKANEPALELPEAKVKEVTREYVRYEAGETEHTFYDATLRGRFAPEQLEEYALNTLAIARQAMRDRDEAEAHKREEAASLLEEAYMEHGTWEQVAKALLDAGVAFPEAARA